MTEPTILDDYRTFINGFAAHVIVFEDEVGQICRLITDTFGQEWVEVVA